MSGKIVSQALIPFRFWFQLNQTLIYKAAHSKVSKQHTWLKILKTITVQQKLSDTEESKCLHIDKNAHKEAAVQISPGLKGFFE